MLAIEHRQNGVEANLFSRCKRILSPKMMGHLNNIFSLGDEGLNKPNFKSSNGGGGLPRKGGYVEGST